MDAADHDENKADQLLLAKAVRAGRWSANDSLISIIIIIILANVYVPLLGIGFRSE